MLLELIRDHVLKKHGKRGLIGLAVLLVFGAAYWEWPRICQLPGMRQLGDLINQWPIQKADPSRFSILVAQLDNDTGGESQRLIVEGLREFKEVQVLVLDKALYAAAPIPEEEELRGHSAAQEELRRRNASACVWGTVLTRGPDAILKLFWTTRAAGVQISRRYEPPSIESQLELPRIFWSDLKVLLQTLAATSYARLEYVAATDRNTELDGLALQIRSAVAAGALSHRFDPEEVARLEFIRAGALQALGVSSGSRALLDESLSILTNLCKMQEVSIGFRGAIENARGAVLAELAETASDSSLLLDARDAFEMAARCYSHAGSPSLQGYCEINLASTIVARGTLTGDLTPHREALRIVAEVDSYAPAPSGSDEWARRRCTEGAAWLGLGTLLASSNEIRNAAACYEAAYRVRSQLRDLQWANAAYNLGTALSQAASIEGSNTLYTESIRLYRDALTVCRRDLTPGRWAMIVGSMGTSYARLGEASGNANHLNMAIDLCKQALAQESGGISPHCRAATRCTLGAALLNLGCITRRVDVLEQSVTALRTALDACTASNDSALRILVQVNLAQALHQLAALTCDPVMSDEAEAIYVAVIEDPENVRSPSGRFAATIGLGQLLLNAGVDASDTNRIESANTLLRAAQTGCPADWLTETLMREMTARSLLARARITHDRQAMSEAMQTLGAVAFVYREHNAAARVQDLQLWLRRLDIDASTL